MKAQLSLESRRLGVIIHYVSVFALMIYIYAILNRITPGWVLLVGIVILGAAIASFVYVYVLTRLWKFTWRTAEFLDERETQVTRESFRKSYQVFISIALAAAIVALVVENAYIGTESFEQLRSFNAVPLMFALVHFAKTLPASMLAWTQTEIPQQTPSE